MFISLPQIAYHLSSEIYEYLLQEILNLLLRRQSYFSYIKLQEHLNSQTKDSLSSEGDQEHTLSK